MHGWTDRWIEGWTRPVFMMRHEDWTHHVIDVVCGSEFLSSQVEKIVISGCFVKTQSLTPEQGTLLLRLRKRMGEVEKRGQEERRGQ